MVGSSVTYVQVISFGLETNLYILFVLSYACHFATLNIV